MDIANLIVQPINQAIAATLLIIIAAICCRIAKAKNTAWIIPVILTIIFALSNAIISIFAQEFWAYALQSLGLMAGLLITTFTIAKLANKKTYEELGAEAIMFLAPLIYHPIFLVFAGLIKLFL